MVATPSTRICELAIVGGITVESPLVRHRAMATRICRCIEKCVWCYRFFLVRYEFPFFSVPSFPSAARSFAVRGCGRMVHPVGHVVKRHQPPQTRDIYHVSHSTRARALSFLFKISSFQRLKPSLIPRPQKKQLATPHTPTHASPNHISYLWSMPLDKRAVYSVSGCKFIRR